MEHTDPKINQMKMIVNLKMEVSVKRFLFITTQKYCRSSIEK